MVHKSDKLVCIILVNWNRCADTLECLASLSKVNYSNRTIIVVDNASSDGSKAEIKKKYPSVYLVENQENLGFAQANNIGVREAIRLCADYIFLLNNDTVVDRQIINHLVARMEKDQTIGLLGCKIYYYNEPQRIWFSGEWRNHKTGFRKFLGRDRFDDGTYQGFVACNNITGCAMFFPSSIADEVGMFDLNFFAYSEDVDWCIRVAAAGYTIGCERSAVLWHKESSTLGKISPIKAYLSIRNRFYVVEKHLCPGEKSLYMFFQHVYFIVNIIFKYALKGEFQLSIRMLQGIFDFHLKRFGKGRFAGIL